MQNRSPSSPLRFASHVTILSLLIVITLATVIAAGLQTFVMPCLLPLLFVALIVPLNALLNATNDARGRWKTRPFPTLQPLVSQLCDELRIDPRVAIEGTDEPTALHTVGSARHAMILGSEPLLERMTTDCMNPAANRRLLVEAILYHELQHVAEKDVRWLAWTRSLLSTVAVCAGWVLLLAWGLLFAMQTLAASLLNQLLQPEMAAQFTQITGYPASVYELLFPREQILSTLAASSKISYGWLYLGVIDTLLPFAIACGMLAAFVWVRMARVREFYADAAVAAKYGSEVARSSLNYLRTLASYYTPPVQQGMAGWRMRFARLNRFTPRFHPTAGERAAAFTDFAEVLTRSLPNGVVIGVVALLLSMLGSGAASVLLFGAQPALLPLLVVFIATSTLMTPAAFALPAATIYRRVLVCAGIALVIASAYYLLNGALALLLAALQTPVLLGAIDLIVRIVYGVREQVVQPEDAPRLVAATLVMLVTMAIGSGLVAIAVCADVWVKRRLGQARGASRHLPVWVLLSTLGVCAGLALALVAMSELAKAIFL